MWMPSPNRTAHPHHHQNTRWTVWSRSGPLRRSWRSAAPRTAQCPPTAIFWRPTPQPTTPNKPPPTPSLHPTPQTRTPHTHTPDTSPDDTPITPPDTLTPDTSPDDIPITSPDTHSPDTSPGDTTNPDDTADAPDPDPYTGTACQAGDLVGTCQWTWNCGGAMQSVSGFCPGPRDMQCCVPESTDPYIGTACAVNGTPGTCLDTAD